MVDDRERVPDGIHAMVPRDRMSGPVRRLRDTYARVPDAPLYRREFGFYCLEEWKAQGMPQDLPLAELFQYDPEARLSLGQLGWCEAAFVPGFEERVVEARGEHEVIQDVAGRHLLVFRGRRSGFMPEYIDHPVKDRRTWEEEVRWRLDPASPERYAGLETRMENARRVAGEGWMICQNLIGGYMYLRSLIGPETLLYAFHDDPGLIESCMEAWFLLADAVIARHQAHLTLDELYLAEDICYNNGSLISPAMMRRFLLPYYQQLVANVRSRQLDRQRHLYLQIDTDGFADPVIPLYRELGMDVMIPFEVAAGCDVVRTGRQYPDLALFGGIDKRILAQGPAAIDRELERILPAMRRRGGYIPTCDHGVPAEVRYEDYRHYRRRCVELGG
ncbi:MAG: uroporphyrinogen decarboxylase family protein [Candidatus Latescibacterota bacterium]|jgi:uroporphyrinogen decarboxylase